MSNTLLANIQAQISELETRTSKLRADAEVERQKLAASVIEDVRAKIAEYGLTAKDLGLSASSGGKQKRKIASAASSTLAETGTVYRSPAGETWAGGSRGRKPRWLSDALAEGKQLAEFAIS